MPDENILLYWSEVKMQMYEHALWLHQTSWASEQIITYYDKTILNTGGETENNLDVTTGIAVAAWTKSLK